MSGKGVPFLDLATQHRELRDSLAGAVLPLLESASFIGGDPVARFEAAYAAALDVPHAVSVKSGTSALRLALEAMGIGPGDEVIVPAYTFIATGAAVVHAGGTPVFADVDAETACMDAASAEAVLSSRTRAMIPVHLYGHPAPMKELLELAGKHDLRVLEDCAQSHLATLYGKTTGSFGDAGAFSFYPSKNLGAGGDAGCVTTSSADLAERVRSLANHGRTGRYHHDILGWNERLDAIQAAILTVKLEHLKTWTALRMEAACRYNGLLEGVAPWGEPLQLPLNREGAACVYHLYVVRHSRRDEIAEVLASRGIGTATHYPMTLPQQPAFQTLGLAGGSFPVSDAWASSCLSLPLFPGITAEQQGRVAEALRGLPS